MRGPEVHPLFMGGRRNEARRGKGSEGRRRQARTLACATDSTADSE